MKLTFYGCAFFLGLCLAQPNIQAQSNLNHTADRAYGHHASMAIPGSKCLPLDQIDNMASVLWKSQDCLKVGALDWLSWLTLIGATLGAGIFKVCDDQIRPSFAKWIAVMYNFDIMAINLILFPAFRLFLAHPGTNLKELKNEIPVVIENFNAAQITCPSIPNDFHCFNKTNVPLVHTVLSEYQQDIRYAYASNYYTLIFAPMAIALATVFTRFDKADQKCRMSTVSLILGMIIGSVAEIVHQLYTQKPAMNDFELLKLMDRCPNSQTP